MSKPVVPNGVGTDPLGSLVRSRGRWNETWDLGVAGEFWGVAGLIFALEKNMENLLPYINYY